MDSVQPEIKPYITRNPDQAFRRIMLSLYAACDFDKETVENWIHFTGPMMFPGENWALGNDRWYPALKELLEEFDRTYLKSAKRFGII